MLEVGLFLVVYSSLLMVAHARWKWPGVFVVILAAVAFLAIGGLYLWPHDYEGRLTPTVARLCSTTSGTPTVIAVGLLVGLALAVFVDESTRLHHRWILVVSVAATATVPAALLSVMWGIGYLGCDTL